MNLFKSKSIDSEIETLLNQIQKWKNLSLENFMSDGNQFKILLREKIPFSQRKYCRLFKLSGSHINRSYSIKSYEIHKDETKEDFLKIYSAKIEGNANIKAILLDLKDIIQGKDEINLKPNLPF